MVLPEDTAVTLSETRAMSNMSARYVKVKDLLVSMNKAKMIYGFKYMHLF